MIVKDLGISVVMANWLSVNSQKIFPRKKFVILSFISQACKKKSTKTFSDYPRKNFNSIQIEPWKNYL